MMNHSIMSLEEVISIALMITKT